MLFTVIFGAFGENGFLPARRDTVSVRVLVVCSLAGSLLGESLDGISCFCWRRRRDWNNVICFLEGEVPCPRENNAHFRGDELVEDSSIDRSADLDRDRDLIRVPSDRPVGILAYKPTGKLFYSV